MRNPHLPGPRFVTRYVHYRTGKVMIASEYGYKAWPFLGRRTTGT